MQLRSALINPIFVIQDQMGCLNSSDAVQNRRRQQGHRNNHQNRNSQQQPAQNNHQTQANQHQNNQVYSNRQPRADILDMRNDQVVLTEPNYPITHQSQGGPQRHRSMLQDIAEEHYQSQPPIAHQNSFAESQFTIFIVPELGIPILRIAYQNGFLFLPLHIVSSQPERRGLTEQEINRLETRIAEDEANTCPICQDTIIKNQKMLVLPCRHLFHHECICPWFGNASNCPVCRANVGVNS